MTCTAFGIPSGKFDAGFHHVFARDVQGIEDHHRNALGLRVQRRGNGFGGVAQHAGELVHRDDVIVPGELVCLGSGRSGGDVVEVAAHHQRPGIIQALQRIRPRTQPFSGNRSFLGGIGQQFFFPQPAFLVSLRSQRSGRMIGQLHFARVARKSGGLGGRDVEKHLFRIRGDHVNRAIAHLHRRPLGMRGSSLDKNWPSRRQAGRAFRDDRFQALHGFLVRSAADVARAVIVIVGEYATDFAVLLDARGPIVLDTGPGPILIDLGERPLLVAQMYGLLNVFRIGCMPAVLLLF